MSKSLVRILLYFKGIIWLSLSVFYFLNQAQPQENLTFYFIALFLFFSALIYFALGKFWNPQNKKSFWLTTLFIVANLILTVTDQMGAVDWFSLITDVLILGIILKK